MKNTWLETKRIRENEAMDDWKQEQLTKLKALFNMGAMGPLEMQMTFDGKPPVPCNTN